MKDYSMISKIEVTDSSDKANRLLEDWWILLDVFHTGEGNLFFVLGCQRTFDIEMLHEFTRSRKAIGNE